MITRRHLKALNSPKPPNLQSLVVSRVPFLGFRGLGGPHGSCVLVGSSSKGVPMGAESRYLPGYVVDTSKRRVIVDLGTTEVADYMPGHNARSPGIV